MRQYRVSESVIWEGIERVARVCRVDCPVLSQFLGTEHQHVLVAQFKVFYHRKGFVCLAQADAVGDDTTVMRQDFVDCPFYAVLLETVERVPDLRIHQLRRCVQEYPPLLIAQVPLKEMIKRLVVDEFRRVILIELIKVGQNFILNIHHLFFIIPKFIKPLFQVVDIPVVLHLEVKFYVSVPFTHAQATHGKVGAAENCLFYAVLVDVVHLPVQQVFLLD